MFSLPRVVCFLLAFFATTIYMVDCEYREIKYKNCHSTFEIVSVEAEGCPGTDAFCPFRRGSEPRIRIAFKPNRRVESMETTVRARLQSVFVPFHMEDSNACATRVTNLTCPLEPNQLYYYSQSVKILDSYPKVDNVQVNWLLNDKSNDEGEGKEKREVCIIFLAKVTD